MKEMPLAFANQNSTVTGRKFSNENLRCCNFNSIMAHSKKPLIGVKRRLSGDAIYRDESPVPKKCFNGKWKDSPKYDNQMIYNNSPNSNNYEIEELSNALIPLNRNGIIFNNDEEMEGIDVVNNLNFFPSSGRFLTRDRSQFPIIPSHLIKGNEIVLFKPEHPINFYKNLENEEEEIVKNENDLFMEGRIEELPNDYEVESCCSNSSNNAHTNDYNNSKFTNGIHFPTIKEFSLGVVELVEDDDDLSTKKNNVSSLSYSSTPMHCTIDGNSTGKGTTPTTTTYNQQLSHGPIFEELSDEDYNDTSVKDDSPMEVD